MIEVDIRVPIDTSAGKEDEYLVFHWTDGVLECTFEGTRGESFAVDIDDLKAAIRQLTIDEGE